MRAEGVRDLFSQVNSSLSRHYKLVVRTYKLTDEVIDLSFRFSQETETAPVLLTKRTQYKELSVKCGRTERVKGES